VPLSRFSAEERLARRFFAGSSHRSATPRFGAGSRATRSSRGSIEAGSSPAIPTSRRRRGRCSTCTRAPGRASLFAPTSRSSAQTRRPVSRHGFERIPRRRPLPEVPCASSTSTNVEAPSHTSQPGTSVGRRCSAGANRRPGSNPSGGSSNR
jgi:hypothetical protein